ncbi:PAS domain-containing protein [Haematococcus lacustris]|uniref:PAS domain-containing protein n=1 Tax=Haematococcus lacustris TaxID=44745 RepID=A0A699YYQ1_HAELA|nr:PAS domain-containing protein [Haematococcus lacustris]
MGKESDTDARSKANRPSFGKRLVRALMFWKPADVTDAQGNTISAAAASLTKRRLHQSSKAVLWLVWPFIFWALFVVVINSLGFVQLASVTSPIATSNIAQFVKFRAKSVMFLSQRLVSSYFLNMDVDGVVVVPTYPVNGTRPIDKEAYRSILRLELEALKKEYSAMLYGRESPLVAGDNTPHFQLATQGVMFSQGADILYNLKGCIALNPKDCLSDSDAFFSVGASLQALNSRPMVAAADLQQPSYCALIIPCYMTRIPNTDPGWLVGILVAQYVDNGLDQAMKQLLYAAESLLVQEDDALDLDNEAFRFIFTCGNSDVTGGLTLLNDRYNSYVQGVYQQAVVLHIITFVVCCLVCVAFLLLILQPYTTGMVAESRRIAELLSHLPPEMDVEALVTGKSITSQTSASIHHMAHTLACMRDTSALIAKAGTDDPQIAIAAAVTAKEEAAAAAREAREANKSGKGRRASLDGPPAPMALTRHGSVLAVAPA